MIVIDLFSGLGGWSKAFIEHGHDVTTIDIEPTFKPTICIDIGTLKELPKADVVLSSPPCDRFSILNIGKYWTKENKPKTRESQEALDLVKHTIALITTSKPNFWIMENPRAKLRKLIGPPVGTITWCQYGDNRMKPTDLWGMFPETFELKKCYRGAPCHISAPRGSYSSTQSHFLTAPEKAKIPYGLSTAFCIACEESLK